MIWENTLQKAGQNFANSFSRATKRNAQFSVGAGWENLGGALRLLEELRGA
jgi:hypothetical protein